MNEILVTGATGLHGGGVARALQSAGHRVAALVRDPDSDHAKDLGALGIELVRGDLNDLDSLAAAFADRDAVYAVTTPFADGPEGEVRQGEAIIAAARRASLPWLILASVASAGSADVPHFVSKARIEASLAEASLPHTVVAPSYFYENVEEASDDGTLRLALPADKPLHQVSLRNLGEVVDAILGRREEHLGARIEVAGDDPTPTEMAAALGDELERLPIESIREQSADLGAMFEFLAETGYGIDVGAVRDRYPEVAWESFAGWAEARPPSD